MRITDAEFGVLEPVLLRCRWCGVSMEAHEIGFLLGHARSHGFVVGPQLSSLMNLFEKEEKMPVVTAPRTDYFKPKGTPFWRVAIAALAGSMLLWVALYIYLVRIPVH